MTHSESNSLRLELARTHPPGDHPDVDVLAAFAERRLIAREREAVMSHLGTCAECRGVLSLAAACAPEQVVKSKVQASDRPQRKLFSVWLPITAAAAGIVIVSSVAIRYTQNLSTETAQALRSQPVSIAARPPVDANATTKKAGVAPNADAPKPVSPALQVQVAPSAPEDNLQANTSSSGELEGVRPLVRSSKGQSNTFDKQATASAAPAPAFSNSVTSSALASTAASVVRPHWRINGTGEVERSFDSESWQTVLAGDKPRMRVLSVYGGEVWAGGEKTSVFRSLDNGQTWNTVLLPEKNGKDHAIIHIRFDSLRSVRIEASDGTLWTSSDGGATWN